MAADPDPSSPDLPSLDDLAAEGDALDQAAADLLAERDALLMEREALQDRVLRTLAETENMRKRAERDRREAESYGATRLARDLLPVYDAMRRALDAVTPEAREQVHRFVEQARWFGGKGRTFTIGDARRLVLQEGSDDLPTVTVELVDLAFDDGAGGESDTYQLPTVYYATEQEQLALAIHPQDLWGILRSGRAAEQGGQQASRHRRGEGDRGSERRAHGSERRALERPAPSEGDGVRPLGVVTVELLDRAFVRHCFLLLLWDTCRASPSQPQPPGSCSSRLRWQRRTGWPASPKS